MKSRMKESYMEGIANHRDPESCVYSREAVGEALTGAGAGPALSSEITPFQAPISLHEGEGNTGGVAIRETSSGLAESETRQHAPKLHAREPGDPARHPRSLGGSVREGQWRIILT